MKHIEDIGCNNTTSPVGNYFTGNLIPNSWYKEITTKSGNPDLAAIALLAEIVYWYRPAKDGTKKFQDDIWQTSYDYFEEKFGYNRQKIRRTFVKLEQMKIILREVRNIKHYGQKFGNVLFIHLLDNSYLGNKPLNKGIADNKKISSINIKNDTPLLQNCSDNIDIEIKKEKNRSIVRNLEKGESRNFIAKKMKLIDFHPLKDSDIEIIQKASGREFDLNATNEILLSMARKLQTHIFKSRQSFFKYMAKALEGELRQAEKVNNNSFKISSNMDDEEKEAREKERFMVEIENSLCNNALTKLKKKIVGKFEITRAYDLLQSLSMEEKKNENYILCFDSAANLLENEKEIILEEAKFLFGDKISILDVGSIPKKQDKKENSENLEIKSPKIWKKVRNNAKKNFGENIDKSWFSRMEAEIDIQSQTVNLKADTSFIRDWMEVNYRDFLIHQFQVEGFALETIYSREVA